MKITAATVYAENLTLDELMEESLDEEDLEYLEEEAIFVEYIEDFGPYNAILAWDDARYFARIDDE